MQIYLQVPEGPDTLTLGSPSVFYFGNHQCFFTGRNNKRLHLDTLNSWFVLSLPLWLLKLKNKGRRYAPEVEVTKKVKALLRLHEIGCNTKKLRALSMGMRCFQTQEAEYMCSKLNTSKKTLHSGKKPFSQLCVSGGLPASIVIWQNLCGPAGPMSEQVA